MNNITKFNNFHTSFKELDRNYNSFKKFLIEFYHHDMPSEPTILILNHVEDVLIDDIDNEKQIIIRFKGGTDVCFKENQHYTNLSNGDVVFSSKKDDETYWLISFYEGVI